MTQQEIEALLTSQARAALPGNTGEAPDSKLAALESRISALEARGTLQLNGTNGVVVSGGGSTFTISVDPAAINAGRTFTATGTINCDADPPTVTITING